MRFFDLHCDTAGERLDRVDSFYDCDMHINLCKAEYLDSWIQLCALFIPDRFRGVNAREYFDEMLVNFKREEQLFSSKIKLCQGVSDLEIRKRCNAILTCEGASPFADSEGAYRAKEYGVKLITLTWNGENEVGYGCQSGSEEGLKPIGKSLLKDMEKLNIVADVSHINRTGFYDVISSGAMVIASHSNSEAVLLKTRKDSEDKNFACRRSLNDEQIKLLTECKGLIGINFCNRFLGDKGDDGFEAVYRHMSHMIDLGCEDVLAIGSDFDGCEINPELAGIDKIPALMAYLSEKGFDDKLLEKIFYENAYKFFKKVLQN